MRCYLKTILWFITFSVFGFFVFLHLSRNAFSSQYRISGSGLETIMVDTKTGNSWFLEKKVNLSGDGDFISPNGNTYYWIPIAVKPCYQESLGVGKNPKEADDADQRGLQIFEAKLKRFIKE